MKKKSKKRTLLITLLSIGVILVSTYFYLIYSSNSFITKWRTIYIETAMSTNSHHWLAEWFIPHSIIDDVMDKKEEEMKKQDDLKSTWEIEEKETKIEKTEKVEPVKKLTEEELFYQTYSELDNDSFKNYIANNPEIIENGYFNILIEDLDNELGIVDTNGNPLLILDAKNNTMVLGVSGEGFVGKLAIIKNIEQVTLKKSETLGDRGETAKQYSDKYDAELVVNASGFKDVGGHGSGGQVNGSLIIDGIEYGNPRNSDHWKLVGINNERLYITNEKETDTSTYKWGIEFFPALIVNGEDVVDGTYGMGIQPRTAIGQAKNGDFLILVVDGRQIGYSLGCTVADCKDLLSKYGAYQAINLDGGSSSIMYYKGEKITRCSSAGGNGRYMPDAIVIEKIKE